MNKSCQKCGTIPATGKMFLQYFYADQEPYESGKEEPLKNGEREIMTEVYLNGQFCEKCEKFIELHISEAPMINTTNEGEI